MLKVGGCRLEVVIKDEAHFTMGFILICFVNYFLMTSAMVFPISAGLATT
jgi:hypothetical protein